jgi:hypothetical protein
MHVLIVILQMSLIITALVVAVGILFYALVWVSLVAASYFPIIGKRHRHQRWDELNKPSGLQEPLTAENAETAEPEP